MPLRSAANKLLLAVWSCGLCACSPDTPQRFDSEFLAMGTQIQLSLLTNDMQHAAQCSAQLEQQLQQQGIDWYPWTSSPEGELKRLNAALAAGKSMHASAPLADLLQRARQINQASDGYFDPSVAPLVQALGFASMDDAVRATSTTEQPAFMQWQRSHPSIADLQLQHQLASSKRHDLQLDLGAIAKGYALQQALQSLQRQDCGEASLNMGGQLAVTGERLPALLPAVTIRNPRDVTTPLASVMLRTGESISTSGDYQRFVDTMDGRSHHLLDPHTGRPVQHTQAVTVISTDATLADAASTALMAAGPDNWQRIAQQLGVNAVLRVDATGAIEVTAALYARLQWNPALTARITQVQ